MSDTLTPSRMEAFSDGVIAVIITIMVLELKVSSPQEVLSNWDALRADLPLVLVYLLSFLQIGIYWVNHHYLIDDVEQVTHGMLWSNLALLFSLSLIPYATNWVAIRGINSFSVALYAAICAVPAINWVILAHIIRRHAGRPSAAGPLKQIASASLYLGAIAVAQVSPHAAIGMIVLVAILWLIPPRRVVEATRPHSDSR